MRKKMQSWLQEYAETFYIAFVKTFRNTTILPLWYTGYFRKVYRSLQVWVPHNILKYLSTQKLPQKRSSSVYLSIEFRTTKIFILCFNLITNINICKYKLKNIFSVIFISIFLMYIMTPVLKTSRRLLL